MNKPAAFRATYSDLKLIKTRQCVQIVFELPLADFDAAYDVLGGLPDNSKETWFAIAPLVARAAAPSTEAGQDEPAPDQPHMNWRDVQPSAQAAMRCGKPEFWAFLREEHKQRVANKDDAATAVRKICGVNSRAHFNTNHIARVAWHQLDSQYQGWLAKERIGA